MAVVMMILRAVQGINALAVLAMAAYVAHWYNTATLTAAPHQVNFLIFAPVYSLVSIAYLEAVPRFAARASHPYAALFFEYTNALFYLAGFAALTHFLTQLLFCRGPVCHAAQATAGVAGLEWALWVASAVLMSKDVFKLGLSRSTPVRPAMKETV